MLFEPCYIEVIIPVRFAGKIHYALPEGIEVQKGDWVNVNFGPKKYSGVVSAVGTQPEIDISKVKPINGKENFPPVTENEIRLWKMMAEYYMCTDGEVFKSAYPPRKIAREEHREQMLVRAEERRQKLIKSFSAKLENEFAKIEKKLASTKENVTREELYRRSRTIGRYMEGDNPLIEARPYDKEEILEISEKIAAGQQDDTEGNAFEAYLPELTEVQTRCLEEITQHFSEGKRVLLKGVTGSGKTEIYVTIAERFLREGKTVLFMVPEIALSRQLEMRVRKFFPGNTLVYHSKETPIRRDEISRETRAGKPVLVLGTRSAIMLPFTNLGCIIIDEEHDSSYKQTEPAPRYNGRDTATFLSVITGAKMLLGSATPSYESQYNVLSGKLAEVELNEKYHHGSTVETVIIDTIAERKKRGMRGSLSLKLIGLIRKTLDSGEQVMVFRSRRSYSPTLQCTECGEMPKCPHCNVYLSYHKESRMLECHYCGTRYQYTGQCPKCSGPLKGIGAGTEKIEEELKALFPDTKVARLDSDTAQNTGYEKEALRSFASGETGILVGTQLISKGFDFDRLALVAVLSADSLVGVQNFRADESAVQLLTQLKGRCARRSQKGLFVLQTEQPEHPVYRQLLEETQYSVDDGLRERQEFGYPPFTRMVEIMLKSKNKENLKTKAELLYNLVSRHIPGTGRPLPPPIDKMSDYHILVIRLRLKRDKDLVAKKKWLFEAVEEFFSKNPSGVEYLFNPDPL